MDLKGRLVHNLLNHLSERYRFLVLAALVFQTVSLFIIFYLTIDYFLKGPESVLYGSGLF